MRKVSCIVAAALAMAGCSGRGGAGASTAAATQRAAETEVAAPVAEADSLYAYADRQVALGPRVPGTRASEACAALIAGHLRSHGADTVLTQEVPVTFHDGTTATARNILGRYNAAATDRVLLLAHYDTRPWADEDADPAARRRPIDGANDGASGVAVLMEMARLMASRAPGIGVDLLFVDAEDSGHSGAGADAELTWCLGTQAWVRDMPYADGAKPRYALLLDMVGGRDARFHREYLSDRMARGVVDKVWSAAAAAGYADRFPNATGGAVTDDHLHINRAGIPCADIIESYNPATGSFNPTWHTAADNMAALDRETMRVVAQVVANVIYSEK